MLIFHVVHEEKENTSSVQHVLYCINNLKIHIQLKKGKSKHNPSIDPLIIT